MYKHLDMYCMYMHVYVYMQTYHECSFVSLRQCIFFSSSLPRLCMYVCVYVYVRTCICVCQCIFFCSPLSRLCKYRCVNVYMYMCMSMYFFLLPLAETMYGSVYVYVRIYVCVSEWMYACMCERMYVHVRVSCFDSQCQDYV